MIEVRIRCESDVTAVRLCDWPADDLDILLSTISQWGVQVDYDGNFERGLSGSFVLVDGEAFFEVLIADESESDG